MIQLLHNSPKAGFENPNSIAGHAVSLNIGPIITAKIIIGRIPKLDIVASNLFLFLMLLK